MSFLTYPSYKKGSVEWLEEVPEEWELKPLKHLAEFINGEAFKPSEWVERGTPIIRIQNLNGGDEFNFFLGDVRPRYHVSRGDLLFGWSGNRGTSFGPFVWQHEGLHYLNQHIFKVLALDCNPHWLYWCLKAVTLHVEQEAHGIIGMVHITKGKLGSVEVPLPPEAQQLAIASFLDRETAQIDALVAEQERVVGLLKEKRQAVIFEAVTKGLDPNVPMTDSGVKWLGEVPTHWTVLPLGKVTDDKCDGPFGSGLKSEHYTDEGVRVIRLQNIKKGEFDASDAVFIEEQYYRTNLCDHDVRCGDILVAGLGDERNTVGRACVAPPGIEPAMVKADCFRFRLNGKKASADFTAAQLTAGSAYDAGILSSGSTRSRIPLSTMATRKIALPPLGEQNRILSELSQQMSTFDALVAEARHAIELLKERRSALISAAVTGKIDVRGLAPAIQEAA